MARNDETVFPFLYTSACRRLLGKLPCRQGACVCMIGALGFANKNSLCHVFDSLWRSSNVIVTTKIFLGVGSLFGFH